jgi:hypothetical protein
MRLKVKVSKESWHLKEPFEIAGQVLVNLPLLLVELSDTSGFVGFVPT